MSKIWVKYDEIRLYTTISQSGGEGKGTTITYYGTDRKTDQMGQT